MHLIFQTVVIGPLYSPKHAPTNLLLDLNLNMNPNPETTMHDDMYNVKCK